jgi:RHS repeat-associated protein
LVVTKYQYDNINRLQNKKFRPVGTTQGSKQTGNWTDASSWLSGVFPLANDNVTINTGHILTIPSGQSGSAGTLNDRGTLRNFGTLNMGKVPTADLYEQRFLYHIRGGIRGYNLDANGDLTNTLFSFKLSYEEGASGYFDGNIRNQYWKSNIDGVQRAYEYSYDKASRIISGAYGSTKAGENYALNGVIYDFNGNILNLSRSGATNSNFTAFANVDNLTYTYQSNSNKLAKVADATTGNADLGDFRDGANTGDDYEYWLDGSLKKDLNKGIDSIHYNYLKLVRRVKFTNGTWINYQYDATGNKLKKITSQSTVTDYAINKVYENGTLYQTSHDEGRINAQGQYEYNITDHLGNLRLAFKDSLGIAVPTQSIFYEPWGLSMKSMQVTRNPLNFNKFQYNGKETQLETGFIDLGNRSINPTIGRMLSIDRFAEKYSDLSGFQFAGNNPIMYVDINGDSLNIAGLLRSAIHLNAFRLFAGTDVGKSFLDNYASKGQKVYDSEGNVIYEAKKDGKYHKDNTNLIYKVGNDEEGSTTNSDFNKQGGMDINVSLAKKGFGSSNTTLNLLKTITHESFIHAETIATDIKDDKMMNLSSTPKEFRQYGNHADHYKVSSQYYSNPNGASLWPNGAQSILNDAVKNLKIKMSNREIQSFMWYFNGSLIKINSKNGKIIYGSK